MLGWVLASVGDGLVRMEPSKALMSWWCGMGARSPLLPVPLHRRAVGFGAFSATPSLNLASRDHACIEFGGSVLG